MNRTAAAILCASVLAATHTAVAGPDCCAGANDTNASIQVSAVLKSASASNGVLLRVTMENAGQAPYALKVCPAMTLCCVRGLHPVINMEETGKGLLDLCRAEAHTPREVFLSAGAAYAFDVRIPCANLPENCRAAGAKFSVQFCFSESAARAVTSQPLSIKLEP